MPTLVIKAVDNDGRLAPLVSLLATPWQLVIADHGNHDAFSAALASADAPAEIPEARPSAYPFHELDNALMTPHGCAWSEALAGRRCRVMAQNLDRLFRGEPLVNIVRDPLVAAPA